MVNMNVAARGVGAVLGGVAAMVLAACGSTGGTGNPPAQPGQAGGPVSTKDVAGVGTVLADKSGKTLYFTDSDQTGIKCTDECVGIWLPATTEVGAAKVDGRGTVKRPDSGMEQFTYQGKPLYTFSMDSAPQTASGHNVKDSFGGMEFTWHAAVVQGAVAQSTPTGGGSGGGGGYGGGGY
jgi:predicted lipoprotein with Yx(FWY)xxD motif